MKLADWISAERGRARQLAEALGLKDPSNPALIYQWTAEKNPRPVPAERCPAIERFTGGAVTCEELNPTVDWAVLRANPSPLADTTPHHEKSGRSQDDEDAAPGAGSDAAAVSGADREGVATAVGAA